MLGAGKNRYVQFLHVSKTSKAKGTFLALLRFYYRGRMSNEILVQRVNVSIFGVNPTVFAFWHFESNQGRVQRNTIRFNI